MTSFSPERHVGLVEAPRRQGYALRDYACADTAQRHIILRHDIDVSLKLATEMAALQASIGVASTHFILVRSEFYNAMAPESAAQLQAIRAHRQVIGLHFDVAMYPDSAAIESAAARECALVETVTGAPVEVASFHRPAPDLIGSADRIAGRINAYGPRCMSGMGCCSDSLGAWRRGNPFAYPAVQADRALQLLTHPIWWMGMPTSPAEWLRRFLAARASFLDHELARHSTVHQPPARP